MKTTAISLVFVISVLSVNAQKLYQWQKQVNRKTTITEFVEVKEKDKEILMSSSDSCLRETGYTPSVSLHDFETGYVALKTFVKTGSKQACFISKVAKPLDETLKIVQDRNNKNETVPMAKEAKMIIRSKIGSEEVAEYSRKFPEFCDNTEIALLDTPTKEEMKAYETGEDIIKKEASIICIILVVVILIASTTPAY